MTPARSDEPEEVVSSGPDEDPLPKVLRTLQHKSLNVQCKKATSGSALKPFRS